MPCDTVIPLWADAEPLSPGLFNLVSDPSERHDLSARYPEIVEKLTRKWNHWFGYVMTDYEDSWEEIKMAEERRWGLSKD